MIIESVAGILPSILQNFAVLSPIRFTVIDNYQKGLKYRLGNPVEKCEHNNGYSFPVITTRFPFFGWSNCTGLHFHWGWGIESIEIEDSVETVMETQYQTVLTKDNKELTISLSVSYNIQDLEKYYSNIQDFEPSFENVCQGSTTKCISQTEYLDILADPDIIGKAIQKHVSPKLKKWGIRVNDIHIVNLSKARPFRLMGNM